MIRRGLTIPLVSYGFSPACLKSQLVVNLRPRARCSRWDQPRRAKVPSMVEKHEGFASELLVSEPTRDNQKSDPMNTPIRWLNP